MSSRADEYGARAERFEKAAADLERHSRLLSNLRGTCFGVFVIAGLVGIVGNGGMTALVMSGAALALFIILVVRHDRVLARETTERRFARVNRDALARLTDGWHGLDEGSGLVPDEHPYAVDLDLVGRGSLFQRISAARTPFGRRALASFLTVPAPVGTIQARQQAARALSGELEVRQRLEVLALAVAEPRGVRASGGKPPDPDRFVAWAEGAPIVGLDPAVRILSRVLPPITAVVTLGAATALLPGWAWIVPVVAQIGLLARVGEGTARVFAAVSETEGAFTRYAHLFELLEGLALDAGLVRGLQDRMRGPGRRPSVSMRRFQRVLGWFELRHNGLVHPFVNAFTLWDIHCVLALEAWQATSGREVRGWLAAIGELEALSSLGGLAYDEPAASWPVVDDGPTRFVAEALSHPLINSTRRVANDVRIEGPGKGLLVTGSNMSGKSTLLRSVGVATVLALAGGPVMARRAELSWCTVRSSLRVRDSLERGVSHFYAEVEKLKQALDAAEGTVPLLFLLDEILHGTNSEERQVGARWVLARLLGAGAIGVVTTHDAELCRLEGPLAEGLSQCHFREQVVDGKMQFDYMLRPGPVRGGNALRLMRTFGIEVPVPANES